MTPVQKARVSIDALLTAASWYVCGVSDANIHAATGVDASPMRAGHPGEGV